MCRMRIPAHCHRQRVSRTLLEGLGTTLLEGEWMTLLEGEGTTLLEGQGTTLLEGEGTTMLEGEGTTLLEGQGHVFTDRPSVEWGATEEGDHRGMSQESADLSVSWRPHRCRPQPPGAHHWGGNGIRQDNADPAVSAWSGRCYSVAGFLLL